MKPPSHTLVWSTESPGSRWACCHSLHIPTTFRPGHQTRHQTSDQSWRRWGLVRLVVWGGGKNEGLKDVENGFPWWKWTLSRAINHGFLWKKNGCIWSCSTCFFLPQHRLTHVFNFGNLVPYQGTNKVQDPPKYGLASLCWGGTHVQRQSFKEVVESWHTKLEGCYLFI